MTTTQEKNNKKWLAFGLWTLACLVFLVLWPAWFWVFLPGTLTSLVLALDHL